MKKTSSVLLKIYLTVSAVLLTAFIVALTVFYFSNQRVVAQTDGTTLYYNGDTYVLCWEPTDLEMDLDRIGIVAYVAYIDDTSPPAILYKYNKQSNEYLHTSNDYTYKLYSYDEE